MATWMPVIEAHCCGVQMDECYGGPNRSTHPLHVDNGCVSIHSMQCVCISKCDIVLSDTAALWMVGTRAPQDRWLLP